MKWLISCFEPFGHAQSNSSEIVWKQLRALNWKGRAEFCGPLPVKFRTAWTSMQPFLKDCDGVLALGQAESRAQISLECLALNWLDARIPDNEGAQPRLVPVREGPDVLWSQIPWSRLEENAAMVRSYSAGAFVCNALMYDVVNWAKDSKRFGGFVHIPLLKSQNDSQYERMHKMDDAQALQACESIVTFLTELNG